MSVGAMAILAAKQGASLLEGARKAQVARAKAQMEVQAFNDQIRFTRLVSNREQQAAFGQAVVVSGTSGLQYTGSVVESSLSALQNKEFETLLKISDIRRQLRFAQFGAGLSALDAGGNAIGNVIQGAEDLKDIYDTKKKEDALKVEEKIPDTGTGDTGAKVVK